MPRIHTVAQDGIITSGDKLIGSDGDPNNGYVTRNYTIGGVSNFVLGGTNAGSFTTITTTGNGTIGGNLSVTANLTATGTISFSNISTYADDAAAGTGGLVSGDVYKKSDGTLMIKS